MTVPHRLVSGGCDFEQYVAILWCSSARQTVSAGLSTKCGLGEYNTRVHDIICMHKDHFMRILFTRDDTVTLYMSPYICVHAAAES